MTKEKTYIEMEEEEICELKKKLEETSNDILKEYYSEQIEKEMFKLDLLKKLNIKI